MSSCEGFSILLGKRSYNVRAEYEHITNIRDVGLVAFLSFSCSRDTDTDIPFVVLLTFELQFVQYTNVFFLLSFYYFSLMWVAVVLLTSFQLRDLFRSQIARSILLFVYIYSYFFVVENHTHNYSVVSLSVRYFIYFFVLSLLRWGNNSRVPSER